MSSSNCSVFPEWNMNVMIKLSLKWYKCLRGFVTWSWLIPLWGTPCFWVCDFATSITRLGYSFRGYWDVCRISSFLVVLRMIRVSRMSVQTANWETATRVSTGYQRICLAFVPRKISSFWVPKMLVSSRLVPLSLLTIAVQSAKELPSLTFQCTMCCLAK